MKFKWCSAFRCNCDHFIFPYWLSISPSFQKAHQSAVRWYSFVWADDLWSCASALRSNCDLSLVSLRRPAYPREQHLLFRAVLLSVTASAELGTGCGFFSLAYPVRDSPNSGLPASISASLLSNYLIGYSSFNFSFVFTFFNFLVTLYVHLSCHAISSMLLLDFSSWCWCSVSHPWNYVCILAWSSLILTVSALMVALSVCWKYTWVFLKFYFFLSLLYISRCVPVSESVWV